MGRIILRVKVIDAMVVVESELRRANEAVEQRDATHSVTSVDPVQSSCNGAYQQGELCYAVQVLMGRLRVLKKAIDAASQASVFPI